MNGLFVAHTLILYALVFHAAYFIAYKLDRPSILDVFWGLGPLFCAMDGVFNVGEKGTKSSILATLAILWGVHFAVHTFRRVWELPVEKKDGPFWKDFYRKKLLLNAGLNMVLSAPLWGHYGKAYPQEKLGILSVLGILVAVGGLALKSYAGYVQWKSQDWSKAWPWNKAQHPDHLGEILMWWGIVMISFKGPDDLWMIASPLLAMGLLIKDAHELPTPGANKYLPF